MANFTPPAQGYMCAVMSCNETPRGWVAVPSPNRTTKLLAVCDKHSIEVYDIINSAIAAAQRNEDKAIHEGGVMMEEAFIKAVTLELNKTKP